MVKDTVERHNFIDLNVLNTPFSQKCAEYDLMEELGPTAVHNNASTSIPDRSLALPILSMS